MIRAVATGGKVSKIKITRYGRKKRGLLALESSMRIFKMTFFFIVFIILGLLVHEGYTFTTTSPLFFVNEVEIEGNHALKRETLISMAGIQADQNIFTLNIAHVVSSLKSIPFVRDVVVSRKLPDRLHIKIKERIPAAIFQSGKNYLMDEDGVILKEIHNEDSVTLPVIMDNDDFSGRPGDRISSKLFFDALNLLYALPQSSFITSKGIKIIKPVGNSKIMLITRKDRMSIIFDKFNIANGLKRLNIIADLMIGKSIDNIDLSFLGQVVVSET